MLPFNTLKTNLIKYKNFDDNQYKYEIIHLYFLLAKKKYQNNPQIIFFIESLLEENLISEEEKNNLINKYNETTKI
jgi:hypothetical protein